MKLSVVVPVYNEKDTLLKILQQIEDVPLNGVEKEIVLVDDSSKDGTTEILRQLGEKNPDYKVIFKEKNEGKGFALRDGFAHTTGNYVIVQDADLEYDPRDYNKLLETLSNESADVVYGSRFSGDYKEMSNLHYLGNKFLTLVTNVLYGVKLTDMETCYKLVPGDFIRSMKINSARFNFEPEITAKILRSGLKITEVPINYRGRSHAEGKKITWRDGISALWTLFKFRFVK